WRRPRRQLADDGAHAPRREQALERSYGLDLRRRPLGTSPFIHDRRLRHVEIGPSDDLIQHRRHAAQRRGAAALLGTGLLRLGKFLIPQPQRWWNNEIPG